MGVRGGLGVNAFRQLHLNIKSNLPPPFLLERPRRA